MALKLTSPVFGHEETIPRDYTCVGQDHSPPLKWSEPPAGTRSFAIICDDPDAPRGTWVHWVLYNLPSDVRELGEGTPPKERLVNGALQGLNDFKRIGYGGPCPPPGKAHRYVFTLYALDHKLDLPPRATKAKLLDAMKGHVLNEAQLIGRFAR